MESSNIWIDRAIWILGIIDWGICLVLARDIASKKGYPPFKSWILGLLGPLGLLWAWRFPPDLRAASQLPDESKNDEFFFGS
jgi:hypothetical protein